MSAIPYSASLTDLVYPCKRGDFFPDGLPATDAGLCVEMSRLAYCHNSPDLAFPQDSMRQVLVGIGFPMVSFYETQGLHNNRGIHCFLAINAERTLAVVCFRGTDALDPTDITDDLTFKLEPWEAGGQVHTGFVRGLADVRAGVDAAIAGLSCRLLITGHSLGAALATLLASAHMATYPHGVELYTFGSPRCGDAGFVATVPTEMSHRYVDCCDVITLIPVQKMGYEHIGNPLYIGLEGVLTENPPQAAIDADRLAAERRLSAALRGQDRQCAGARFS